MSNSLNYIKEISQNPNRWNLDVDISKAKEFDLKIFIDMIEKNNIADFTPLKKLPKKFLLPHSSIWLETYYDSDADFNYFTTYQIAHDGTLIFEIEAIIKCINKVLEYKTYNNKIGEPQIGDTAKWTFGNPIVFTEYGKQFATIEKHWLLSRTSVLLPIKYERFNTNNYLKELCAEGIL